MNQNPKYNLKQKKLYNLIRKIRMVVFDFDGVFTDDRVLVLEDGTEGVFCFRGDGLGLKKLKQKAIALLVISSEVNPVVTVRCKKLGLPCVQGCDDKVCILEAKAKKLKIPLEEIAYVGNDINDIGCLKKVGLPVCIAGSPPELLDIARYITKSKGGYGAVREFCDFVVMVKNE